MAFQAMRPKGFHPLAKIMGWKPMKHIGKMPMPRYLAMAS
jgi:hypothetical protein